MANSILDLIANELETFFEPVSARLRAGAALDLMTELGWHWPESAALDAASFIEDLDSLKDAVAGLDTIAEPRAYIEVLKEAIELARSIGELVDGLPDPADFSGANRDWLQRIIDDKALVGERLVALLVFRYLEARLPTTLAILRLFGVVRVTQVAPSAEYPSYQQIDIEWSDLPGLFSDPSALLAEHYSWGGSEPLRAAEFLEALQRIAFSLGLPAVETTLQLRLERGLLNALGAAIESTRLDRQLEVPLLQTYSYEVGSVDLGVRVLGIPAPGAAMAGPVGIAIIPFAHGESGIDASITPELSVATSGTFSVESAIGVLPGGRTFLFDRLGGSGCIDLSLGGRLRHQPPAPFIVIGARSGSRFEYAGSELRIGMSGSPESPDLFLEFALSNAAIVVQGSDGDSFLNGILPSDPPVVGLNFTAGYSSARGFYCEDSEGLEATIPLHRSLGALELESAYVSLGFGASENSQIQAQFGLSALAALGPISTSVERVGIKARLAFPGDDLGNLGPADLTMGFVPPTGAGLSVDGFVKGGGFLDFDAQNKRYAGDVQLRSGELVLRGSGLITTRMPDGSDGFALLVVITAEFSPPIQLPYGFTLAGVGGLIALNRTMDVEALRAGLRARALDSILFPQLPIQNPDKIISDLRSVFPPVNDRIVIGPIVKLGWGSPTIVRADIGIFLELPEPVRVALLGQVSVALPREDNPIVSLHVDVLGVIDFQAETLSIDSTIYDSQIFGYALTGDAAARFSWGDSPSLALALGGFHPGFAPPAGFPALRRLTLDLSRGRDLQLYCSSYLAITSNTVQFGAAVALHARKSGATLEGALSFDTLIYLSPFAFVVDISGNVVARYRGKRLASVLLRMQLSGPTPWNAQGRASFGILCWDVSVRFNETWGPREPAAIPLVEAWSLLKDALERDESWGARLPAGRQAIEALAPRAVGDNGLLVHPLGSLEVRQSALPLAIELQTIGGAPIDGATYFDIERVSVTREGAADNAAELSISGVEEAFAKGQFLVLSDSQRLSLPAFETMKAGVSMGAGDIAFGAMADHSPEYETILIREDLTSCPAYLTEAPEIVMQPSEQPSIATLRASAAGRSGLLTSGRRKYAVAGKPKLVKLAKPKFQVVDTESPETEAVPVNVSGLGRVQAEQKLSAYLKTMPELAGRLRVAPVGGLTR